MREINKMGKNYVTVALADGVIPVAWSYPMTKDSAEERATKCNLNHSNGYTIYAVWTVEKLKSIIDNPFEGE